MNEETLNTIQQLLSEKRKIVIVGHKNPDADAIGSCCGLHLFLQKQGHDSHVIMPNSFPAFLNWLPGNKEIVVHDMDTEKSLRLIHDADIIFTLDFNAFDRVGMMQQALENATAQFVMIDHHQSPAHYAVATYSDTSMSSTCEMVYHFIDAMDGLHTICKDIATLLYTGIMTDTGSFRFPSTSATTHKVISHLMEFGAQNSTIHEQIYDTYSTDRMKLLGVALNNLTVLEEINTAYITISQKELDTHNFKKGDTEGFVNYALKIQGIVFAVIFIENKQENIVKMSLRSKGSFSVNEFARSHYHGGGHTNAAGGRSDLSLADTVSQFIAILPDYKEALTNAS